LYDHPLFRQLDNSQFSFLGFSPTAVFSNIHSWRTYFSLCALGAGALWLFFGFDSVWSQLNPFITYFTGPFLSNPQLFFLQPIQTLQTLYHSSLVYYGIGNHFSAPVIYGTTFVYYSLFLEQTLKIRGSLNFFTTTSLSLLNIGIFEWLWNGNYAYWQNQPWTITLQWKQITNLVSFSVFITIGLLVIVYYLLNGYRLNNSPRTKLLGSLSLLMWLTWIFYPLPIDHISVETTTGTWTNTARFPQTYYAVDTDPLDNVAIGSPNHVENDFLHFWNTLTKVITTWFLYSLYCFRRLPNVPT